MDDNTDWIVTYPTGGIMSNPFQGPGLHFAYLNGFVCTANADGTIPLNSKVVAKLDEAHIPLVEALLKQANRCVVVEAELAKRQQDDFRERAKARIAEVNQAR